MKERILDTSHGQFELRAWTGKNESGIWPLCDKVVVLVDPALKVTRGGVMLTDQTSDTQTLSSTTGILVAVGDQAFVWDSDRATRWEGDKPKAGARVCFQRYSGQEYFGLDGQLYRVLQDRSIGGAMGMAAIEEASDAGADLFETAAA